MTADESSDDQHLSGTAVHDLDQFEVRILGCLVEKEATTPDVYPLSLNALRTACNQSTNRDPVVSYEEPTIRAALDEAGIAYLHLQKLGTPAEGRTAARAGRMDTMRRIYDKHLKTHDAIEAMDELLAIVESGKRVCLLCFERDPAHCHRSIIAGIVHERTGAAVDDLMPEL